MEVKDNSAFRSSQRFAFQKAERLSGKKVIDELFSKGSSFHLPPFKIISLQKKLEINSPAQVLISVPAKIFKRAVDRNKIKRLVREAYRLNKNLLYDSLNDNKRQLLLGFVYTSKTIESFSFIREKIILVFQKLREQNAAVEKSSD